MSHPVNTQYLETAHEGLQRCIAAGDYALCRHIINGTSENGFELEARDLEKQLLEVPISNFQRLVWNKA